MKPDIAASEIRLTTLSKSAGCAAKIGPGELQEVLSQLPKNTDQRLLVGTETSDDAAVFQLTEDMAMVQTLDFFSPMVDDPYTFGQIAAANALSDIYAMGGTPVTAMNIVAYPNCLGTEILGEILKGGASKVQEAGASLAGGHSINDEEPKYGLSVTGLIHPDKIRKNCGAQPGDVLILTKPIGCGLINTAVKAEMASEAAKAAVIQSMTTLNKYGCEVFQNVEVHACTDVTGFGLAGHVLEMAKGSGVSIQITFSKLPVLPEALEYARMGLVPEGSYRNRAYVDRETEFGTLKEEEIDLVCDPQTSGGLLVSVPQNEVPGILEQLKKSNQGLDFAVIGTVLEKQDNDVYYR